MSIKSNISKDILINIGINKTIILIVSFMSSLLLVNIFDIYSLNLKKENIEQLTLLEVKIINKEKKKKKEIIKNKNKKIEREELKGIIYLGEVETDKLRLAIINIKGNKNNKVINEGDYIDNNTKLLKINKNYLEIKRNNKKYNISLNKVKMSSTIVVGETKKTSKEVLKLENKSFTKEELSSAIKDFSNIYHYFKFKLVKTKKGRFPRVTYVKSGSIIEEIGIQVGDIVTYINGVSIMDSVKIMKMMSKARELTHFNVSIIRDGSKGELNYEIY